MPNPLIDPKDSITIHISSMSILKLLVVIGFLALVYLVWDIIVLLFVALILAATLDPSVSWLERKKIPRAVGILFIYGIVLFIFSLVIVLLIPPVTEQIEQLSRMFPFYYDQLMGFFGNFNSQPEVSQTLQSNLQSIGQTISKHTGSFVSTIYGLFGGIVTFIMFLVLTFYFSVKKDGLKSFIHALTPVKYRKYAAQMFVRMQDKLGLWLRGQIILSLIIFLVTWIGLSILGVRYALVLAIIAGITEVVPFIGPIIGAVPAVILAFLQSPIKGLLVVILYFVIQQLEGNILVPKVMQKAVGMNPIVVIVVILLGSKLAGVLGAVLSIPVAVSIMTIAGDWFDDISER